MFGFSGTVVLFQGLVLKPYLTVTGPRVLVLGVLLPGAVLVGVDGAAVSLLGLDDLVVDVIKDVQHPAKMMGELFGERRRCTAGRCC